MGKFAESSGDESRRSEAEASTPVGDVYDWYVRGRDLLSSGNAAAAAQILSHTVEAEPQAVLLTCCTRVHVPAKAPWAQRRRSRSRARFTGRTPRQ